MVEEQALAVPQLLRAHSHVHAEECSICCFPVEGENGPADLRLSCGCALHYFCGIKYLKGALGDKARLLAKLSDVEDEQHKGILCPNAVPGGSCASIAAAGGGTRTRGAAAAGQFITLADLDELLTFRDRIQASPRGQSALGAVVVEEAVAVQDVDALFLSQDEVDKLREWLHEPFLPPPPPLPEEDLDPFLLATTKPCPTGCGARGTHFQGHHCHHVDSSCPTCHTHYCWSCDATKAQNEELRGAEWCCACKGKSWRKGCARLCTTFDIASFLVLTPYPHDSRCGCPICPDCKEGDPCALCGSPDGNWNCAVCQGFILPGPRELDPNWVPQTEEMKERSARVSQNQRKLFNAAANGNGMQVLHLLRDAFVNVEAQVAEEDEDMAVGATALFLAAERGYEHIVSLLILIGANVNTPDEASKKTGLLACLSRKLSRHPLISSLPLPIAFFSLLPLCMCIMRVFAARRMANRPLIGQQQKATQGLFACYSIVKQTQMSLIKKDEHQFTQLLTKAKSIHFAYFLSTERMRTSLMLMDEHPFMRLLIKAKSMRFACYSSTEQMRT